VVHEGGASALQSPARVLLSVFRFAIFERNPPADIIPPTVFHSDAFESVQQCHVWCRRLSR